jgi:putative ATPase
MSGDLFGGGEDGTAPGPRAEATNGALAPLADRMRPRTLDEVVGQVHLIGPDGPLRRLLQAGNLPSLLLWGPPGCGKTTLARLVAGLGGARFLEYSAVAVGSRELKEVMAEAGRLQRATGRRTILFLDEIHRFNKAQQDALLPWVERGDVTLIGATTENPSFEVNSALISRTRLFVLAPLSVEDVGRLLRRAAAAPQGLDGRPAFADEALDLLARLSEGDARAALGLLESVAAAAGDEGADAPLDAAAVTRLVQTRAARYDKAGEEHFNLISALHKSMRNSDPQAAVYWLARMLESGEDPLYVARRLVRFASEDVGLAAPDALVRTIAARDAAHQLGMPEGAWAAQAAVYPRCACQCTARTAAAAEAGGTNPGAAAPAQCADQPDERRGLRRRLCVRSRHAGGAGRDDLPARRAGRHRFLPAGPPRLRGRTGGPHRADQAMARTPAQARCRRGHDGRRPHRRRTAGNRKSRRRRMKRIGVLTGGGDAAGMNAALRAVVRTAWRHGAEVIGINKGWLGLAEGTYQTMSPGSVSGILQKGGTILRTFRYPQFATAEGAAPVGRTLKKLKLDGMVIIGGDGSFRGGTKLEKEFGIPCIGVPATIDNDIPGTDYSIGFDTALNIAIDAVDKVRDTATSHGRIFVIEVMGREYGLLAAQTAIATGAEEVLLPEVPWKIDEVCSRIADGYSRGKHHALIIVAEGAGKASYVSFEIKARLNRDVRMVVLGHVQRGGAPSGFDRILASRLGHHAAESLFEGQHGIMVGVVSNKIQTSPLEKKSKAAAKAVLKDARLMELLV